MKYFLLFFIFISIHLFADNAFKNIHAGVEKNSTLVSEVNATLLEQQHIEKERLAQERAKKELAIALEKERQSQILRYKKKLATLKDKIDSLDSVWLKSYNSNLAYKKTEKELDDLKGTIAALRKNKQENRSELDALLTKETILKHQIELLKGDSDAPFATLLQPEDIGKTPEINNPFDIFTGLSFIKQLDKKLDTYKENEISLRSLIFYLREYKKNLDYLADLDKSSDYSKDTLLQVSNNLDKFELALDTVTSAESLYVNHIRAIKHNISNGIEAQSIKLFNIGITITILFAFFFLLRIVIKRYITDNDRFYMANKILTFANFTIILLVLLFSYMENVSYLVTVLGFASAGIAIAMKDWFMSILGWLVIVFGGSIHVGDRIRVDMDGMKYVGDVLDISLLRMTLLEDITLTTYHQNRRAGRILFVPNNYVFTRMVANYTHSSLKTVWDGIDITITFDSNHKKAIHIAKEITRKYAKGYTDITRKQLNKLRSQYNLKNSNVEPRIFSFIEENGVRISSWYLTNAYATLTLRSNISMEILDAYNAEDDIVIAYPTQKIHFKNENNLLEKEPPFEV